ncbi:MAG TPA: MgtC/SapB family protein [Albitalea sp.]|jgi:putative Mg2+ transporter-C (MgtC) family protein|nr:MgtC/SapB family protein [Albitalea sp.]
MDAWQQIGATLIAEFSDLPDAAEATRVTLRLTVAALLGGLLGFEREMKGKDAGVRTHMLVALGAALFVLVPEQMGVSDADLTRVVQGIIAGIGFLGAGTIIKRATEDHVRGLTTAAGIWLTAAIGVAAGQGREATALLSALLAFGILWAMPRLLSAIGLDNDNKGS